MTYPPYQWTEDPSRVAFEGPVDLAALPTRPGSKEGKATLRAALETEVAAIAQRQRLLWAHDTHALLLVFQGMDAAGKDSTIRHVLSGVNPAGCRVRAFEAPSRVELDHDFLWRHQLELPRRGRIGVFNRSHYEEVLVVRVHPELLANARLRSRRMLDDIWTRRFRSIRGWERHLADNGTVILKFFLHLSKDEQRERLLRRLDRPDKRWKFDPRDLTERTRWDEYQAAWADVLQETSRPWAPWYAIPADDKPAMRLSVAQIVRRTLDRLDLSWPNPLDDVALAAARATLNAD